jgi:hypothetical protein
MIAVHFENLVFLLFILGALLFQLLTRAAGAASKDSEEDESESSPPPPPMPRGRPATDEERIREFLEALGQPTTSKPPPRVQPRPTYQKPVVVPHVPPFASPLPPLTTRPPDLPREIRLPGKIPPTRGAKVFLPKTPEPLPFEVQQTQTPLESPPAMAKSAAEAYAAATQPTAPQPATTHFATLLRSTSSLRDAIVLREIFGPPRSLQPLELTNII